MVGITREEDRLVFRRILVRDSNFECVFELGVIFMADVTIQVRDNGPIRITGPFTLVDADGKEFELDSTKPAIAICRCGTSAAQPFCDGSHKSCGFESCVRAES